MKTYIFSNCKKTDNKTFAKNLLARVPKDAQLIILNRGNVYFQIPEFKQYPNQIFICRQYSVFGIDGYFGTDNLCSYSGIRPFHTVVLFNPIFGTDKAKLIIGRRDKSPEHKEIEVPWMKTYQDATGKSATSGYSAYYLVQQLFNVKPEDIILVNFYGNEDNSTNKYKGHDWSFEDRWNKDKMKLFL